MASAVKMLESYATAFELPRRGRKRFPPTPRARGTARGCGDFAVCRFEGGRLRSAGISDYKQVTTGAAHTRRAEVWFFQRSIGLASEASRYWRAFLWGGRGRRHYGYVDGRLHKLRCRVAHRRITFGKR